MKKTAILLMACGVLVLTGCQSKEEKQVQKEKKEFVLLYEYSEDKVRPVILQEKTPEELVEEIVMEDLGMDAGKGIYKERGVLKGQGVFVESAIREGAEIPQVSAIPVEERDKVDSNDEENEARKKRDFEKLQSQRRQLLKSQYENDGDDKEVLLAELKKRLEQQEKRGEVGEQLEVLDKNKEEDTIWDK